MSDVLRQDLCRLAALLTAEEVSLVVGGAYGLLLRAETLRANKKRTRFPEALEPRSTEDIDCFLGVEVITDPKKTEAIRNSLSELGYEPVTGAEYYQFAREVNVSGQTRSVKFDFHAAPVLSDLRSVVKQDDRRIRPHGFSKFHAHATPEALSVTQHSEAVDLDCGEKPVRVWLPHPVSYLVLKLFALRDQINDPEKNRGRHHAMDVYTTVALTTEEDWATAGDVRAGFRGSDVYTEARRIVADLFQSPPQLGVVRLKEAVRDKDISGVVDRRTEQLVGDLSALFPE